MLKKTLLLGGAAALAASSAFAAGFDVNVGEDQLADISSGTVSVDDCTDDLLVDVVPSAYDLTEGDWSVLAVHVTSASGDLTADCAGFEVTVAIETQEFTEGLDGLAGTVAGAAAAVPTLTDTLTVAADTVLVLTPASTVWIRDITEVAVLVDEPNL